MEYEQSGSSSEDEVFFGSAISSKERKKATVLSRRRKTMGQAELNVDKATDLLDRLQFVNNEDVGKVSTQRCEVFGDVEDDIDVTPPNSPALVTSVRENSERRQSAARVKWSAFKGEEEEEEKEKEMLRPIKLNFSSCSPQKEGRDEEKISESDSDAWETNSEDEEADDHCSSFTWKNLQEEEERFQGEELDGEKNFESCKEESLHAVNDENIDLNVDAEDDLVNKTERGAGSDTFERDYSQEEETKSEGIFQCKDVLSAVTDEYEEERASRNENVTYYKINSEEEEEYRRDLEHIAAEENLGDDAQDSNSEGPVDGEDEEVEEQCISETIGEFLRDEKEEKISDEDEVITEQQIVFPNSLVAADSFFTATSSSELFLSADDEDQVEDKVVDQVEDKDEDKEEDKFEDKNEDKDEDKDKDRENDLFPRRSKDEMLTSANSELEGGEEEECEPSFDTTVDEMLLYDIFGENYDENVEAMGLQEKVALKRMLAVRKAGLSEEEVKRQLCQSLQLPSSPLALASTHPPSPPSSPPTMMRPPSVTTPHPKPPPPTKMRPPSQPPRSKLPQPQNALRKQVLVPASPVAAYLRSNPGPSLVHNVPAKQINVLESTLLEVEEDHPVVCFLPTNTYKAAASQEEKKRREMDEKEYPYIPRAYGQQQNAEVRVTKHLGRKDGGRVSLLETRVVRKFGTPLQREEK